MPPLLVPVLNVTVNLFMREPLKDKDRLLHMIAAIDRIFRYTEGKSYEDLVKNDMMYYAVVKNIEIIGEAANMLTTEFQTAHPETPWKMVKGMRNYIVQEYFQIDDVVVWDVVVNNLQPLKQQLQSYLITTDWDQWSSQSVL